VIAASAVDGIVLFGMAGCGSAIAMSYAVRHPGRVTQLVLYGGNTVGLLGDRPTAGQAAEAQGPLKIIQLGWAKEHTGYGNLMASRNIPDSTANQFRSSNDILRRTTTPANAIGLLDAYNRTDVRDIVPQVRCPTLVLHPRGDSIVPVDRGRDVAALIPA